jgi:hypothetical protein
MKNIKYILSLTLLVMIAFSCDDDLTEVNENPNQPTEVPMSTLLPNVIIESVTASVNQSYLIGNNVAQLTAKTLRVEVDIYQWASFDNLAWTPFMNAMRDTRTLELLAEEQSHDNYRGIAMIMRTWMFSVLTDAYGNIPYQEAARANEDIIFPAYQSQEEIYTGESGLIATLTEAVSIMGPNAGDVAANGDLLYGGDIEKWRRFGNALKMRLLLRVANVNPSIATSEMQNIVNSGVWMQSNEDNAALSYLASPPYQYPLVPLKVGDFDAVNLSERLEEEFKTLNDPRLEIFARPVNEPVASTDTARYEGLNNGDDSSVGGSRLGYLFYDYPGHTQISEKAEGIIMTYPEFQFILAEAVERGWINTGLSTEDHYRAGIEANMNYYGVSFPYTTPPTEQGSVTFNSFDDYYAQPSVDLDQASNTLARIGDQKWIALFFHGLEPWFEWKRTGFPALNPTPDNENNDQIPVRFLYPGSEQTLNQENYQSAVDQIGGDNINNNTWWDNN